MAISDSTSELKRCAKCKQYFPPTKDYFWRAKYAKDGLRSYCKTCNGADNQAYNKSPAGRKVMHRAEQKYNQTEHGKQMKREKRKRYAAANPNKERARKAVNIAVRRGDLPRVSAVSCTHCGKQAQTYHHDSYEPEHWLDVIPLCLKCHRKVHANEILR